MRINTHCLIFFLAQYVEVTESRFCAWSSQTVENVTSCPLTTEEYEKRRDVKNCELLSQKQNCTEASNFRYHCVMNECEDALVEVCAPAYTINGFCAEFNIKGGRIQLHNDIKCSDVNPPCPNRYISTDAYLYRGCYDVIKRKLLARSTEKTIKFDNASGTCIKGINISDSFGNRHGNQNVRNGLGIHVILVIVLPILVFLLFGITLLCVKKSKIECACQGNEDEKEDACLKRKDEKKESFIRYQEENLIEGETFTRKINRKYRRETLSTGKTILDRRSAMESTRSWLQ